MANEALRTQVGAKWQEAFSRLNRGEPGISGLMTFAQAWVIATTVLRPKNISDCSSTGKVYSASDSRAALALINQCRRLPALLETFLDDIRKHYHLILYEIQGFMRQYEESLDTSIIRTMVFRLVEWYKAWAPQPELGNTIHAAYTLNYQTHLFSSLPPSFSSAFKNLCASTLHVPEPDNEDEDPLPTPVPDLQMWEAFETLGLIDRFESIIASVGYERIEQHVLKTCTGQWENPMLEQLRAWMSERVVPWMLMIYARNASTPEEARTMLQGVGSRFDFHINKTLCDLRTREIFDIIIDFPDSKGALQDLQDCLQRVDQRTALVTALRKANRKRLLHPGADTKLILAQYVSTIKLLLFKVADPIRRYLRGRPDTIRSIVANLVGDDDNGDSLVDENEPIQPLQQPDVEDYSDPNWDPEPIDAGPEFRTNKPSDIISTLVSIYDSKDLFVKELQVLLAQRLLAISNDEVEKVEKERRNVEILKIRFGEAALQVCEPSVMHPTILSSNFWPALGSSDIVMPGQFQKLQESYTREFQIFKPDKRLKWFPHLGTVTVELELQDRTLEVNVPPLEAAFIELFSQKNIWSLDELMSAVGSIDKSAALRALLTWVDHGVLKEDEENMFRLLEIKEEAAIREREHVRAAPVPDDVAPVASLQQQQAEKMRVYWKFIEGMLTNLGQLPLDRIQSMLKLAPGYDQTVEQLGNFMDAARREDLVTVHDGIWKLKR
ncbi:hypothetical protein BDQ17DRAFT_1354061 [Cyathus striatus]|nr:hypothetical protein BDQ17DRAFT_1354061 [Cyathus striatus]